MTDKSLFQTDPRDFALQLVADGLVTADHLLMCALKYMSHDDVRDLLDCNELSPRFEDEDDTVAEWLDKWDDGEHDVEAMRTDIENGNLEAGDDEAAERYNHDAIVRESITNGQHSQALEQCNRYGLDWEDFAD